MSKPIFVPNRRAPRLPRDHFAMMHKISRTQRAMRAIALLAVTGYVIALILHRYW